MEFSDSRFLVTLNGLPNYELLIWSWRTGDKLVCMKTDIHDDSQYLSCSMGTGSPFGVAQISKITETQAKRSFVIWDVYTCGGKCIARKVNVQLPLGPKDTYEELNFMKRESLSPLIAVLWTVEPTTLLTLDKDGTVYAIGSDRIRFETIVKYPRREDSEIDCIPNFTSLKNGIVIAGPDGQISFWRRSASGTVLWQQVWNVAPYNNMPLNRIFSRNDVIVGWSPKCGDLSYMYYDPGVNSPEFQLMKSYGGDFIAVIPIYPMTTHFVTLDTETRQRFTVWKVDSGESVHTMTFSLQIMYYAWSIVSPLVSVCKENGLVVLLGFFNPEEPKVLWMDRFMNHPMDVMKFSQCGKYLITASREHGHFFVLRTDTSKEIRVVNYIEVNNKIVDCVAVILDPDADKLHVFVLLHDDVVGFGRYAGYRLLLYKQSVMQDSIAEYVLREIDMRSIFAYTAFDHFYTTDDKEVIKFYAIPQFSNKIHKLNIHLKDLKIDAFKEQPIGHMVRSYRGYIDNVHVITYGADGLLIVRNNFELKSAVVIAPHSRSPFGLSEGIVSAFVDVSSKYAVSLGTDNSIVCTRLHDREIQPDVQSRKLDSLNENFVATEYQRDHPRTWLERQYDAKIEKERIMCAFDRDIILSELTGLRKRLVEMLDWNFVCPDNERLPIQEFNLDKENTERMVIASKEECEQLTVYLEAKIEAQDKVSQWLKKNCWDIMDVPSKSIYSLFGDTKVENYALLPMEPTKHRELEDVFARRQLEILLQTDDSFQPWLPLTEEEMKERLLKPPTINVKDQSDRIKEAMEESDHDLGSRSLSLDTMDEDQIMQMGSTTHRFIDTTDLSQYNQCELKTFLQKEDHTIMAKHINYRLRVNFNKQFNELEKLKQREVSVLKERNNKFRHILSELNWVLKSLSDDHQLNIYIKDPEIKQKETPESIIVVKDSEVKAPVYISPSQQAILDARAAEEERIRKLLMADDFRERALIVMMDGVLEVRWEDEIRKDVPVPKCMRDKKPEDFNEEDLRIVYDYKKNVEFLQSERSRYRKILETEYVELRQLYQESIGRFNTRVADLFIQKLKVEAAICQENFRMNRIKVDFTSRYLEKERELKLKKEIVRNEESIDTLQKNLQFLVHNLGEMKNYLDMLSTRDKNLDRNFKKEFTDVSPMIAEQLYKLFKKRPKVVLRTTQSAPLCELARAIMGGPGERPRLVIPEYTEYARALDTFEQHLGAAPASVSENNAALLRHLRRQKIECEIKIRAVNQDIVEGEMTMATFQRMVMHRRDRISRLVSELTKTRQHSLFVYHNFDLQLVMKKGLVEVPLTGSMDDYKDAVVIKRSDVEEINSVILNNGERKLKSMRDAMNFRRGILSMEWQHKFMRMKIQDLVQKLHNIDSAKITKDVLEYIFKKNKPDKSEKDIITIEEELEIIRSSYTKQINEQMVAKEKMKKSIVEKKVDSRKLDTKISMVNVDICEKHLKRDRKFEQDEARSLENRMTIIMKRSRLIKKIQEQHNEILVLQTELELLRLKTYPTLKYKTIN